MSNYCSALTVVLEKDLGGEQAAELMQSIALLRGVLSVQPIAADVTTHIACERARAEIGRKVLDAIYLATAERRL